MKVFKVEVEDNAIRKHIHKVCKNTEWNLEGGMEERREGREGGREGGRKGGREGGRGGREGGREGKRNTYIPFYWYAQYYQWTNLPYARLLRLRMLHRSASGTSSTKR